MAEEKLNCFEKLNLLLWKNFKMQTGNWIEFIFLVLICAVFPSLFILFRLLYTDLVYVEPEIQDPINLMFMEENISSFLYSPTNKLLNSLVEEVGAALGVRDIKSCTNSNDLVKAITKLNTSIGIEFPNDWSNLKELPNNFHFALHIKHYFIESDKYTDNIYNKGSEQWNIYLHNGFLATQQQLSICFLKRKNATAMSMLPSVILQPLPYPGHNVDEIIMVMSLLPYAILIGFIYPCMTITKYIVAEKELQLKELMSILGISDWMHWLAWYIKSIILLLIFSIIIAVAWTIIVLPKASVALLPYSSLWPLLLLFAVYCHSCIAFCFLASAICSRSTWAGLTSCLLFIATFLPQMLMATDASLFSSILASMFLNSAMTMLLKRIELREAQNIGLQFNNLFRACNHSDKISVGSILLIMLVIDLISILICLYVEQVHPGEYGVKKTWCFPCKRIVDFSITVPSFCGFSAPDKDDSTMNIEPPPKGKIAGVEIKALYKSFGSKEVVHGITFNMLEDEITVLLGHNGAGKTTTILMLAGVIPPSSGTALINGYDICTEREKARLSLGICPQHNVLFNGLSVANHIHFFCRLRCLRGADLTAEINRYMQKLNLETKAKSKAINLSGGAQRRLSLACALCGNVKVVFCDEPSSGLDPASRHSLWKLLQEEKQGRTILLTTHYMDEGEVLGDRIAIMSDGKLRSYGTMGFLKKTHDTGYVLSCERGPNCKVAELTALILKYIPKVVPYNSGADINYRLPQRFYRIFGSLFEELEASQSSLDVLGFGISATSLADIFMSVGAEDLRHPGGEDREEEQEQGEHRLRNSFQHCLGQWEALLLKKIFYTYHNKIMFLVILLIPILLWILSIIQQTTGSPFHYAELDIELAAYRELNVIILMENNSRGYVAKQISTTFAEIAKSAHIQHIDLPVLNYTLQMTNDKPEQREIYDKSFLAAVTVNDGKNIFAWFATKNFPHAAALTMNLVYNSLAQVALNGYQNISISVTNKPFQDPTEEEQTHGLTSLTNVILIVMYLSIALSIFVFAIVHERTAQLKMQQQSAGVNMLNYWLTHYLWDLLIYLCFVLALLMAFNNAAPLNHLAFILFLIGLAGIPFTYVMGTLFKSSVMAFTIIIIINLVVGVFVFFVTSLLYVLMRTATFDYIMTGLYFYPLFVGSFALARCFFHGDYCQDQRVDSSVDSDDCDIGFAVANPMCACESIWSWVEVKYLLFAALLWFLLILFLEYQRLPCYAIKFIVCWPFKRRNDNDIDADVAEERGEIANMKKDHRRNYSLVVDRASKLYCCFRAVKEVSFKLKPGICFGLLGANGAGKTSLFKMIAGDKAITSGNIYIKGINMKTNPYKALQHIGYCPQFDTLFTFLTGRQMLKIFCLLRGVPRKEVKKISESLAANFGFLKHLDKKTKDYSGGTKRKLNAALAASGESLILLDEPSAGVDPASRRDVWKMLQSMRADGKAIVISSHSMEEVEAVCTRVAIMANGNIHSLGSQQRIKNKYSKSFVLKLSIDPKSNRLESIISKIENQMANDFPSSTLEEKYEFSGRLTFNIPNEKLKWWKMFRYIENNYNSWQLIDYSLTQKNLENIFLDIVKNDEEKRKQKNRQDRS